MNYEQETCAEDIRLDKQLKDLREELLKWQTKFQEATSEIEEREAQIAQLSTFIADFDQIVENYEGALPDLRARQEEYEKYYQNQKSCLKNILGESCWEKVCKKAEKYINDISEKEKEIECDVESLEEAQNERTKSAKDLANAKAKFEQWKTPVKSIESRFKTLDQLKKEIGTEHKQNNNTIAFYLLTCKDKFCAQVNGAPKVLSLDEFKDKIKQTWKCYSEADSDFNEKDAAVKGLEKTLETKRAQLEEDRKNLESTIRRKLIELANSEKCAKTESENCSET